MKRILFSPVGSTDPIANFRDGALLHITRVYKPDVVYMYMSHEMLELENKDHRYTYCLEQLKNLTSHNFELIKIERDDLKEVHIFDYFLEEFEEIISSIERKYEDEGGCEILLNVTSGTPAIQSALHVIAALTEKRIFPIQVSSPNKAYNAHREDVKGEYLVYEQWECNEDNKPAFENRCSVSADKNMVSKVKKEIIRRHIEAYDYVAACRVADTMENSISEDTKALISAGESRIRMDKSQCDRFLLKTNYDMFPIKSGEERKIFEYLVIEKIKLDRGEYMEFIRGITPLLFSLMVRLIDKEGVFDLNQIMYQDEIGLKRGICTYKWKKDAEKNSIIISKDINAAEGMFVSSDAFWKLYEATSIRKDAVNKVRELRDVERKLRNPVAHNITYVSEDMIKEYTESQESKGLTASGIFDKLVDLVRISGIKVTKNDLQTYDLLNEEIIRTLGI